MNNKRYALAACLLTTVMFAGCSTAKIAEPDFATLIAHRGESFDAPENTLVAYKTAVDRGFGFECDIYLS
jgi:glycerophosphoryl diester phosphodiesterase